jgi:hypothetical protein
MHADPIDVLGFSKPILSGPRAVKLLTLGGVITLVVEHCLCRSQARDEKMWRVVLGLRTSVKISHSNGNETHKKFVGA